MPRIAEAQTAADKAVRLFTYLKELSELRSKTVRSVSNYEQFVWLADLPDEPGCRCAAWFPRGEEEDDVWVEVKRPQPAPPPPMPSSDLQPWLNEREIPRSDLDAPPLRDKIPQQDPDPLTEDAPSDESEVGDDDEGVDPENDEQEEKFDFLIDHPEITQAWERYVERSWRPWAEHDRRIRAVQRIYTDLFSIYQQQQRLGEQFEVVLGLGLLSWRTPSGPIVNRHLIIAQLDLTFDAVQGIMAVGPAAEGSKLTLEHDMLEAVDRPEIREQEGFAARLDALGDQPWQEEPLNDLFSAWVHSVSSRGRFESSLTPEQDATGDPIVRLAPAIILRKRTERSLIRVYDEIIAQVEQTGEVPLGVRRLVEIVDDNTGADEAPLVPANGHHVEDPEIYFPLPANDEQLEIVERLTTRQGVLVQGPPGTGKSHTIANLICHLLATGNRVLVTSHTPRALQVLRDKIPPEVADLCVTLLGSDREALQDLEDSVHGITSQYDQWNPARNQHDIDGFVQKLDQLRRRESELQTDLTAIRERETRQHDLGFRGYAGTAAVIARRVAGEESLYGWLSDDPVVDDPPLPDDEVTRLLELLHRLSEERCREVEQPFVPRDQLTPPEEFARLCQNESAARERSEGMASARSHPAHRGLSEADPARLSLCAEELRALQSAYTTAQRQLPPWAGQAVTDILAGQDRSWQRLRELTSEQIDRLVSLLRDGDRQVVGLDAPGFAKARADAATLLAHLKAGGGMGFGPFRAKSVKDAGYLIDGVTVDGQRCDKPGVLQQLIDRIDITTGLDDLRRVWQPYQQAPPSVPTIQVAFFQDLLESLDQALALGRQVAALRNILASIPGVAEPLWQEMDEVGSLLAAVEAAETDHEVRRAATALDTLEQPLQEKIIAIDVHPVVWKLLESVRQRNATHYADAWATVRQLEDDRLDARDRRELWDRLNAGAPNLASALKQSADEPAWDQRLVSFSVAWDWARANRWLTRLGDPAEFRRLTRDLDRCRSDIHQAICDLAAARAWRHFFDRMTEPQRQHLIAWTQAMRRVGKGTGKYAPAHRRAARDHMDACRTAIPAWIMPIYRVAETVNPGDDQFDVIIVDEASQSGPEALFLQFLGKKILVVGDDKQISPEFVGMDRESVNLLRARYLHGLPHNDALGVDTSFFDQAQIRYGGRIRLREHFRCMPEIIQFSNNLCYADEPLIPLRQYGTDRLPPVAVTHVSDGYRAGRGVRVENLPEAEAVVEHILRCCDDPAYDDKSMGVISLQGENQAKKIQSLLLDRLGPEEMERRRLTCGDAYAFQGDERDVMFLSLVAAPGGDSRIGTLSSARDERRFNVAASRARDQMWLFHSATLQDLSERGLRYKLLDYCLNPHVESLDFEGIDIEGDEVVPPFESIFEQKVYAKIRARGYRVIPQVEVAGYRLDLVVEGMRGRLAVECDGDAWHGPDRYADDMARQRQLERCGWTIWRVRGSTFFRDPDEALEDLWQLLDKLDIRPAVDSTKNDLQPETPARDAQTYLSVEEAPAPAVQPSPWEAWQPDETEPVSDMVVAVDKDESVVLSPFVGWQAHLLPDPRSSSLDEILFGLVEIVRAEGPMLCSRAYRLYASVTVGEEFDRQLRSTFNKAMYRAIREGRLLTTDELTVPDMLNLVVRAIGCPTVVLRERGDRLLGEIPPLELASLMRALGTDHDGRGANDLESVYTRALSLLGLERRTESEWQTNILVRAYSLLSHLPGDA